MEGATGTGAAMPRWFGFHQLLDAIAYVQSGRVKTGKVVITLDRRAGGFDVMGGQDGVVDGG